MSCYIYNLQKESLMVQFHDMWQDIPINRKTERRGVQPKTSIIYGLFKGRLCSALQPKDILYFGNET